MRTVLRRPTRALFLLGVSALALGWSPVEAQSPQGGTVAKGAARISQTTRQSTIRQTSQRAVIDWKSFDVGRSHKVVFDQPGKSSATLNRVNSVSKSVIRGAVTAPGTVIIQNSAGVIFTKGAKVDVGGLVATSQTVDAERFQRSGSLRIGGGDRPGARVINQGDVTIGETGLAALVGRNVQNAGAIIARTGTVALASGTRTTIDFGGDGAIQIAVSGEFEGRRGYQHRPDRCRWRPGRSDRRRCRGRDRPCDQHDGRDPRGLEQRQRRNHRANRTRHRQGADRRRGFGRGQDRGRFDLHHRRDRRGPEIGPDRRRRRHRRRHCTHRWRPARQRPAAPRRFPRCGGGRADQRRRHCGRGRADHRLVRGYDHLRRRDQRDRHDARRFRRDLGKVQPRRRPERPCGDRRRRALAARPARRHHRPPRRVERLRRHDEPAERLGRLHDQCRFHRERARCRQQRDHHHRTEPPQRPWRHPRAIGARLDRRRRPAAGCRPGRDDRAGSHYRARRFLRAGRRRRGDRGASDLDGHGKPRFRIHRNDPLRRRRDPSARQCRGLRKRQHRDERPPGPGAVSRQRLDQPARPHEQRRSDDQRDCQAQPGPGIRARLGHRRTPVGPFRQQHPDPFRQRRGRHHRDRPDRPDRWNRAQRQVGAGRPHGFLIRRDADRAGHRHHRRRQVQQFRRSRGRQRRLAFAACGHHHAAEQRRGRPGLRPGRRGSEHARRDPDMERSGAGRHRSRHRRRHRDLRRDHRHRRAPLQSDRGPRFRDAGHLAAR